MSKNTAKIMSGRILLSIVAAVTASSTHLLSQPAEEHAKPSHGGLYSPAEIQWKSGPAALPPGAKMAVLEGDPSKEGFFVMRIRVPDGYHIPAHTHPKTERVTVLSGTFKIAMGEHLDRSAAKALPAGSFGFWPAGMKHEVWAEGDTAIQVHGVGPWTINYLNPADDPRNTKAAQ